MVEQKRNGKERTVERIKRYAWQKGLYGNGTARICQKGWEIPGKAVFL